MNTDTPILPTAIFEDAARDWLEGHKKYIKLRTVTDYRQYIASLTAGVFGGMRLKEITIQTIRTYQDVRSQRACAARINMELSTAQQILKDAGLWPNIQSFYRPLPISRKGSGHALTAAEESKLFEIAFSRPRWRLAAHCLMVMYKTGCGFGEIVHLRRGEVDLQAKLISVNDGAKNEYRARTVPLIPEALDSMQWLVDRWESLGGSLPDDFLLPHRADSEGGRTNFALPMGSIKKAWSGIRKEAIKQIGPHMAKVRIYDARVTAITRMLSDGGVSLHAAQTVAGHISQAMQKRYYRPGTDTLREALSVLGDPARIVKSPPEPKRKIEQVAASVEPAADSRTMMLDVAALVRDTGIAVDLAIEIVNKTRTQIVREAAFNLCEKIDNTLGKIPGSIAATLSLPKKKAGNEA